MMIGLLNCDSSKPIALLLFRSFIELGPYLISLFFASFPVNPAFETPRLFKISSGGIDQKLCFRSAILSISPLVFLLHNNCMARLYHWKFALYIFGVWLESVEKMADKKQDIRVTRSKEHIWRALVSLINDDKRPFEVITINDICERAMVHRTTFYKHFEDKDHLLSYCVDQMKGGLAKFTAYERLLKPFQCLAQARNNSFPRTVLACMQTSERFNGEMEKKMMALLKEDMSIATQGKDLFSIPDDIVIQFYVSAVSGLAIWWTVNGQSILPEQMDEYYHKMVNTTLLSGIYGKFDYFQTCLK
jgi:AcrR family transcriptional regulator